MRLNDHLKEIQKKYGLNDEGWSYCPYWAYVTIKHHAETKSCCNHAYQWGFWIKGKGFYIIDKHGNPQWLNKIVKKEY